VECLYIGEPAYANSPKGMKANFEIKMDLNGEIQFRTQSCISPCQKEDLRMQIDKAIRCSCIQLSGTNFGSPLLFFSKPDSTLCMCIDYCAVNTVTVKDPYPLPHIEDLLNSMHGSCLFRKLDLTDG
jgi:putative transposase